MRLNRVGIYLILVDETRGGSAFLQNFIDESISNDSIFKHRPIWETYRPKNSKKKERSKQTGRFVPDLWNKSDSCQLRLRHIHPRSADTLMRAEFADFCVVHRQMAVLRPKQRSALAYQIITLNIRTHLGLPTCGSLTLRRFFPDVPINREGAVFSDLLMMMTPRSTKIWKLGVEVDKHKEVYSIITYRGKKYRRPVQLGNDLLDKRRALKRSIELQRLRNAAAAYRTW